MLQMSSSMETFERSVVEKQMQAVSSQAAATTPEEAESAKRLMFDKLSEVSRSSHIHALME